MKKIRWWVIPLVVNIVFLACTVGWSFIPKNTGQEYLTAVSYLVANMSLRGEMTLAVWWSGVLMFGTGLTCYEIASRSSGKTFAAWLFFAVVFVGFAVDEMASIHERLLRDWRVIIFLMLAGGAGVLGALRTLFRNDGMKINAVLLMVGIGLMASAAPQEYLEHSITWNELPRPQLLWNLRLGVEEGSEIFGALLCLIGAVNRRRETGTFERFAASIPNPMNMSGLFYAAVALLLLHVAVVVTMSGRVEIGNRGDPFVIYPTLIFLVASALNVWTNYNAENVLRRYGGGIVLSLMSLFIFYFLSTSTTVAGGGVRAKILLTSTLFILSAYLLLGWSRRSKKKYAYLVAVIGYLLITASFLVDSVAVDHILYGVLSLTVLAVELASVDETPVETEPATP